MTRLQSLHVYCIQMDGCRLGWIDGSITGRRTDGRKDMDVHVRNSAEPCVTNLTVATYAGAHRCYIPTLPLRHLHCIHMCAYEHMHTRYVCMHVLHSPYTQMHMHMCHSVTCILTYPDKMCSESFWPATQTP